MQPAAARPVCKLAASFVPRVESRGVVREHRQPATGAVICRGAPALLDHPCAESEAATDGQLRKLRLVTAIKTPYLTTGRFDLRTFDSIVEHQIANGVDGLIIGGTTGEGQLMSWDEHIMLIAHTVNRFGSDVAVIGNTGSNSTREAVHATEQGFAVGMHAALQINPYYGKTSQDGLNAHFDAALAEGPAIVYNVPARTGQDIPDAVIHRLASHRNFMGVKECTGNARIEGYSTRGVTCWSGNDDEAHAARHQFGAGGVISVTSNLIPGLFSTLMAVRDDQQMDSLQELIRWLFSEPNPIGVNTAMAMCGLIQPVFRLPYVPMNKQQRVEGCRLLERVAEHIPGVKDIRPLEDDDFLLLRKY